MDVEIAPEVRRGRVVRRAALGIVALGALVFLLAATVEWLRPSIARRSVETARVGRGSIESILDANGVVVPLAEQVVSSPIEARVLRVGHRAGDRVHAGDVLLTLDTAGAQADVKRLEDRVSQLESGEAQLSLQLDESIANVRAQIEQRKLDAEIVHYTAEQRAKLQAEGLIAEQDALAAAAAAKKSDIELRQLQEALSRALRSRDVQLAASHADLSIARRERDEARRQLDLAMLRANRDGVLTWVVPDEGSTVRRGDLVARIADLSAYRVEATISDIHASRLAAGMPAIVKLDGLAIGGRIDGVDPRIVNGVVKFFVALDRPSHPQLRNNLRVDVSVVTGRRANVLVVRRGALGRTDAGIAFVVRDGEAIRSPVRFGIAGDDRIEIAEGLRQGDEVVISDMSDFNDVARVRLK